MAHPGFFYSMTSVFNLFKFIIKFAVLGALQPVCGKREFLTELMEYLKHKTSVLRRVFGFCFQLNEF